MDKMGKKNVNGKTSKHYQANVMEGTKERFK